MPELDDLIREWEPLEAAWAMSEPFEVIKWFSIDIFPYWGA